MKTKDKELRMYFWDYLRKRLDIDVTKIKSRKQLIQTVRKKLGLQKYRKAKGKQRSILGFISKPLFWRMREEDFREMKLVKVKREGKIYWRSHKRWTEEEVKMLRELKDKNLKPKQVYNEFVKMGIYRSYDSIRNKYYRI